MRIPPTSASPAFSRRVADVGREATRLCDREVAGVGTGARDDVAGELGAGFGHADRAQALVQVGELLLGEPAECEVLTVGDADLDAEVALDLREAAELVAGDVAEAGPRVRADGAVGAAAHDVAELPLLVWRQPLEVDGRSARSS